MINKTLLLLNLRTFPHQPATCIFRTIEIDHILKSGILPKIGYGLDLGCGDGRITKIIMERSKSQWQLIGLDADPEEIALAKEIGIYEELYISDAARINKLDNSLDFVFSNSVLEHIGDLKPVLAEISRILKPDGQFIFTVPSSAFPHLLGGPGLFGRLASGTWEKADYLKALDERVAHLRYWDEHEWRRILQPYNLTLTHASYYLTRQELRRWELLSNATAGLLVRCSAGGKAPIDIQRHLKIRQTRPPSWLVMIACLTGFLATIGIRDEKTTDVFNRKEKACLLGCATKLTP
jgi:SAM-dependent methyltransferase